MLSISPDLLTSWKVGITLTLLNCGLENVNNYVVQCFSVLFNHSSKLGSRTGDACILFQFWRLASKNTLVSLEWDWELRQCIREAKLSLADWGGQVVYVLLVFFYAWLRRHQNILLACIFLLSFGVYYDGALFERTLETDEKPHSNPVGDVAVCFCVTQHPCSHGGRRVPGGNSRPPAPLQTASNEDQSIASLGGAALPRRHVSLCVRHRGLHRGPSEQEPDHLHLEPQPHNSHGEALCCCFFPAVYSLSCFREILIDTQPVSCVMPFSWWVLIIIAFVTLCGGEKLNFSLDSGCFSAEVAVEVDMCCLCFVFLHVKLCRTSVKAVILLPWYKESNVVWYRITVVVTGVVEYCGLPESGTHTITGIKKSVHTRTEVLISHTHLYAQLNVIFLWSFLKTLMKTALRYNILDDACVFNLLQSETWWLHGKIWKTFWDMVVLCRCWDKNSSSNPSKAFAERKIVFSEVTSPEILLPRPRVT